MAPARRANRGRKGKVQEPKQNEAPPHLVRALNKAIKKAKVFQLRKCLKKSDDSSKEDTKLNQQVEFLKSVRPNQLTRKMVEEIKATIPRKVEIEWANALKNPTSEAANSISPEDVKLPKEEQERIENQIRGQKAVVQSLSLLRKMIEANNTQLAANAREARKVLECTEEGCGARFATEEGRKMHMTRRHGTQDADDVEPSTNTRLATSNGEEEESESDDSEAGDFAVSVSKEDVADINKAMRRDDYFDHHDPMLDEVAGESAGTKKRKNRMGQRERRRQGILRERKEAMEARRQGLPPPPKRKRPDTQGGHKVVEVANAAATVEEKAPEVLHPSWEAMKKLKNPAIVPFKGTKVTFDDSDDDE